MPDLITEKDPVIAHSYSPTHPEKPAEYAQALQDLETAYCELIRLTNVCEASGEFDYSRIDKAKEKCLSEEKRKDEMYARFYG